MTPPRPLTKRQIQAFRRCVYSYYSKHGRSLPWRKKSITPYQVFVSEVMLQQTQVDRVAEKYPTFIKTFRNFRQLASARFFDVMKQWQGLGYNRRALFLYKSAQIITGRYSGRLARDPAVIETLPGIGPASAASICAFAFNLPVIFIETNIRSVFIHHFFAGRTQVSDRELLPLVTQTLDTKNPSRWYSALMDYGVYLKKVTANPSRRSRHYVTQSRFEGSNRQIRGAVIRLLNTRSSMTADAVSRILGKKKDRVRGILRGLTKEGFLIEKKQRFRLTDV